MLLHPPTSGVIFNLDHSGSSFYIHTNANGATNFEVFRAPLEHVAQPQHWQLIVPHNPDVFIEGLSLTSAYMVLLEKVDALNRITIHDLQCSSSFHIDFPEEVYCLFPKDASSSYYFNANIIRFSYSSPTTPSSTYQYCIPTKQRECIKVQEIPSGHNPADYRVSRLNAAAPDGQLVPVFLLHHAKTSPSASSPLYVYESAPLIFTVAFSIDFLAQTGTATALTAAA
jgi:oligopeptidase B